MKLPRQITIKGEKWKIKRRKRIIHEGVECDGLCSYEDRTITIRSDASLEVLVHEGIHAALMELHITLDYQLDEVLVDGLTTILFKLFDIKLKK